VFRTTVDSPRVLIANSNLVPKWRRGSTSTSSIARADDVRPDDGGLLIYTSAAKSSGHVRDVVEAGRQHYGGDLGGRWILTAGPAAWAALSRSPRASPARRR
jgi:urocanate hydratase